MHGADEFLYRNCVILKCEAVAQVGQHKSARTRDPFISNESAIEECVDECQHNQSTMLYLIFLGHGVHSFGLVS